MAGLEVAVGHLSLALALMILHDIIEFYRERTLGERWADTRPLYLLLVPALVLSTSALYAALSTLDVPRF